jgi:hypothetical protein
MVSILDNPGIFILVCASRNVMKKGICQYNGNLLSGAGRRFVSQNLLHIRNVVSQWLSSSSDSWTGNTAVGFPVPRIPSV